VLRKGDGVAEAPLGRSKAGGVDKSIEKKVAIGVE